jgi:hypothetical protein
MASHIFSSIVHNYMAIGKLTLFLELSKGNKILLLNCKIMSNVSFPTVC